MENQHHIRRAYTYPREKVYKGPDHRRIYFWARVGAYRSLPRTAICPNRHGIYGRQRHATQCGSRYLGVWAHCPQVATVGGGGNGFYVLRRTPLILYLSLGSCCFRMFLAIRGSGITWPNPTIALFFQPDTILCSPFIRPLYPSRATLAGSDRFPFS